MVHISIFTPSQETILRDEEEVKALSVKEDVGGPAVSREVSTTLQVTVVRSY